jgi:hypothetical protein
MRDSTGFNQSNISNVWCWNDEISTQLEDDFLIINENHNIHPQGLLTGGEVIAVACYFASTTRKNYGFEWVKTCWSIQSLGQGEYLRREGVQDSSN